LPIDDPIIIISVENYINIDKAIDLNDGVDKNTTTIQ